VEGEAEWRPNGGRRARKQQEARLGWRFSKYTMIAGNTVNFKTFYVNIENMKAAPGNRLLFCCHHHIQDS
jgi:hypothetical protein